MTFAEATPADRGLQPERTALAWTRTSLSIVGSGMLVLLKDRDFSGSSGLAARVAIAGPAAVLALAVYAVGVRRRRALTVRPLPQPVHPRRAVLLVGMSVVSLTLVVVAYLMLVA
ncbi:DUF202 domain-containing protein [Mycobacterium arosiense]|uniref:DUF202 domain-containing protein n=1 Tax=Mycobacterium arosiense ATCC BAA-1401 = DSM 45069 TaxID=1265311 RepID=A0A1W9Z9C6_MYCAI|nr:DUF202 domain-containing protein [Mycobacterium arosiense]ORA09789.1 hypothetical protein BST14_21445 [Mycobacterium arosiense ATCC BAA-1401 = DSM 45069]